MMGSDNRHAVLEALRIARGQLPTTTITALANIITAAGTLCLRLEK